MLQMRVVGNIGLLIHYSIIQTMQEVPTINKFES